MKKRLYQISLCLLTGAVLLLSMGYYQQTQHSNLLLRELTQARADHDRVKIERDESQQMIQDIVPWVTQEWNQGSCGYGREAEYIIDKARYEKALKRAVAAERVRYLPEGIALLNR